MKKIVSVIFMFCLFSVKSQHVSFDSIAKLISNTNSTFNTIVQNEQITILLYHPEKIDKQQPHTRDEYYFVMKGIGQFFYEGKSTTFKPGDVLYAAAGKEHRFENFSDDLFVWVLFYGPALEKK